MFFTFSWRFILILLFLIHLNKRPQGFSNLFSAYEHMLKTNTIRDRDSAGFSTKTQMSIFLPLFFYYLCEYLEEDLSKSNPLLPKFLLLKSRIEELLSLHHPNLNPEKILELRPKLGRHLLKWRVDLLESEKEWVSWFLGITKEFLNQSKQIIQRTIKSFIFSRSR